MGFGLQVALLSGFLTLLILLGGIAIRGSRLESLVNRLRILSIVEKAVAVAALVWLLPSLLQPMDGWQNLGDSTEKFLDEITGWTVGSFPGVHASWVSSSILGLPLAPLSLLDRSPVIIGAAKIVIVVLYVNALVLCVPTCVAAIFGRCVPRLTRLSAFGLAVLVVSVSGTGEGNTSVFQELSFLARGLLPIALGAFVVARLGRLTPVGSLMSLALGVMSSLVLLNNYEYGFGSATSALATLAVSLSGRVPSSRE